MIDLPPPPEPPACVIIIQADDLGYDDLGVNGNPIVSTPNLDALAKESVTALRFTVNPVCAASRASLLTGRHFLRTGVAHVHGGKDFLHRDEVTLADAFREAGWNTATWGKWHCGDTDGYFPWDRGFDEAYMANLYQHRNANGSLNGEPVQTSQWSDELLVDFAMNFLREHRDERNFLYLTSMTPHTPLDCPDALKQPYLEMGLSENLATLYGMITMLDQQVGRLLDYLHAEGLAEDTLLLFISDNGPAVSNGILSDEDRAIRKTSARRGWKGDIWENGVRSPFLLRWPAVLKQRIIRAALDQVDLYPTLLELCGIPCPDGQPDLDGASIATALLTGTEPAERAIYNYSHPGWITSSRPYTPVGLPGEYNPVSAGQKAAMQSVDQPVSITRGRYKLLFNPFPPEANPADESRFMLIDLFRDPGETSDVKSAHPELYTGLKTDLIAWHDGIKAAPHAYTSPVFTIGETTGIAADSVTRLSGSMQNTVFSVQGWTEPGQFAVYAIEVAESGWYEITLEWIDPPPSGCTIEASSAANSIAGQTDGGKVTIIGPLELNKGGAELKIMLTEKPVDLNTISQLRFVRVHMTR